MQPFLTKLLNLQKWNILSAEMTRLIRDCQPVYGFTQPETVNKLREAGDAVQCIKVPQV